MNPLNAFRILIVPGLHGSGPLHWQSRWEALYPRFERVEQYDWEQPDLEAWADTLESTLRRSAQPTIVVAHSFGCLVTAHQALRNPLSLAGALLVAPAHPARFGIDSGRLTHKLPVPSLLLASRDDPWLEADLAKRLATRWGSQYRNLGRLGHINAESGLGDWPQGQEFLLQAAQAASQWKAAA